MAAACSAAQAGAHTLLGERERVLGGNVGRAWVHTICGLFIADSAYPEPANAGFPLLFVEGLLAHGIAGAPARLGRVHVLPINPCAIAEQCASLYSSHPDLEWPPDAHRRDRAGTEPRQSPRAFGRSGRRAHRLPSLDRDDTTGGAALGNTCRRGDAAGDGCRSAGPILDYPDRSGRCSPLLGVCPARAHDGHRRRGAPLPTASGLRIGVAQARTEERQRLPHAQRAARRRSALRPDRCGLSASDLCVRRRSPAQRPSVSARESARIFDGPCEGLARSAGSARLAPRAGRARAERRTYRGGGSWRGRRVGWLLTRACTS